MNPFAKLTSREDEIAELIAWGATKKDIANILFISPRTVENHARNIYEKTGCRKSNELSAWWFCKHFHISFSLSPLARTITACALLCIYLLSFYGGHEEHRSAPSRNASSRVIMARRRQSSDKSTFYAA